MSISTLEQTASGPVIQGYLPLGLPLLRKDSNFTPKIPYTPEPSPAAALIIEGDSIIAKFSVDRNVDLDLTLTGEWVENENKFQPEKFFLFYQIKEPRPRAHFIVASLMAVLGLAGKLDLHISNPEVSTTLNFELPLLEISKLLRRRQVAYRLMVIEEATGKRFLLPPVTTGKEIEAIAFVYHAIIDRSFVWTSGSFELSIPATPELVSLLAQPVQPFSESREVALSETVLGQPIDLGRATVTMEDAVVQCFDEAQQHLTAMDGHQVPIVIHSLSGRMRYEFTEAPSASELSWDSEIQALIDIEPQLDAALVERYHALAAATLDGLNEEEKKEITTRPELGEAFLIDGSDGG